VANSNSITHTIRYRAIIHEDALNSYDWQANKLGLPKLNGNTITFCKNVKLPKLQEDVKEITDDVLSVEDDGDDVSDITYMTSSEFFNTKDTTDFNFDFYLWNKLMKRLFGQNNYDYTEKYYYKYRENRDLWGAKRSDLFVGRGNSLKCFAGQWVRGVA